MDNDLIDLLDRINARELGEGYDISRDFFTSLGFDHVNFAIVSRRDDQVIGFFSNMRRAWLDRYVAADYALYDVMVDYAKADQRARVFDQAGFAALPSRNRALTDQLLREVAAEEGLISSIIIPRHSLVSDRLAGFNLTTPLDGDGIRRLVAAHERQIFLAAAICQEALIEDYDGGGLAPHWYPVAGARQRLSPRELETLKWLSAGLRNDRIAEKLGVVNATVNFHIGSAKRKLGAQTREQAVATAIMRGLI